MLAQAHSERPLECCGLLAGIQDAPLAPVLGGAGMGLRGMVPVARVMHRYPLTNALASPTEYLSDAQGMFDAVRDMRRLGTDVIAVYHSHPTTHPVPSRKDLERNYSPDVVNFIISLKDAVPEMRGWWLTADEYQEAQWELIDDEVVRAQSPARE